MEAGGWDCHWTERVIVQRQTSAVKSAHLKPCSFLGCHREELLTTHRNNLLGKMIAQLLLGN